MNLFFKNNFIEPFYLKDNSICDDLIKYFKECPNKEVGTTTEGTDKRVKDSVDVVIPLEDVKDSQVLQRYCEELFDIVDLYNDKYPFIRQAGNFGLRESINIQYYKPGGGYFNWHSERDGIREPMVNRHLVFMTYLNTVKSGGETEFYHQKVKVKPKKGKTLIWPSEWTHIHRGRTSFKEDKYIITGWFSFFDMNNHELKVMDPRGEV